MVTKKLLEEGGIAPVGNLALNGAEELQIHLHHEVHWELEMDVEFGNY